MAGLLLETDDGGEVFRGLTAAETLRKQVTETEVLRRLSWRRAAKVEVLWRTAWRPTTKRNPLEVSLGVSSKGRTPQVDSLKVGLED